MFFKIQSESNDFLNDSLPTDKEIKFVDAKEYFSDKFQDLDKDQLDIINRIYSDTLKTFIKIVDKPIKILN